MHLTEHDLQTLATALRIAKACGAERPALLIAAMECEERGSILRPYEDLVTQIDDLLIRTRVELAMRIINEETSDGES